MALVMLPCDLPWWCSVQNHLNRIKTRLKATEISSILSTDIIDIMKEIHDLCNISLDPDQDDIEDPRHFNGLLHFFNTVLSSEEHEHFFTSTLPCIVNWALCLKDVKPKGGLHFSLQQQSDVNEFEYKFVASLLANAFFSTFPRRTSTSHPTLSNFNFNKFFRHLSYSSGQQAKLKSFFHYFDWLQDQDDLSGHLIVLRQVMTGRDWLTVEDWLECTLPLCNLIIKHEGKLDQNDSDTLHVCFTQARIGDEVLNQGISQESINFLTYPELLTTLLNVEALEDNEAIIVDGIRHLSRINCPKKQAIFEPIPLPKSAKRMTMCCIDADNYSDNLFAQYEEDNILRELNKSLLAFQQRSINSINNNIQDIKSKSVGQETFSKMRRLSPIGESISSTSSSVRIGVPSIEIDQKIKYLPKINTSLASNNTYKSRKGRFIVLGSSGECLPVNRRPVLSEIIRNDNSSTSTSRTASSEDEFYSAKSSMDEDTENKNYKMKKDYSNTNAKQERLCFAQRLRDAIRREISSGTISTSSSCSSGDESKRTSSSSSEDYSYGKSNLAPCRRRIGGQDGSTGFVLVAENESRSISDFNEYGNNNQLYLKNKSNNNNKQQAKCSARTNSTNLSLELEEVYEQFSQWLKDPVLQTPEGILRQQLQGRDLAVVQFAGSLLKRTLSESFAGTQVPLMEDALDLGFMGIEGSEMKTPKIVLSAKSLSMELAKQKHKLAAQLLADLFNQNTPKGPLKSIATGNWGCGSSRGGHVQLKALVQWLSSSVAGVPIMFYYTYGHSDLTKFDTVVRIVIDRKWTVKDLLQVILRYANRILACGKSTNRKDELFDFIIRSNNR